MERLQGTSIGAVLLRAQLDGSAVEQQPIEAHCKGQSAYY